MQHRTVAGKQKMLQFTEMHGQKDVGLGNMVSLHTDIWQMESKESGIKPSLLNPNRLQHLYMKSDNFFTNFTVRLQQKHNPKKPQKAARTLRFFSCICLLSFCLSETTS